MSQSPDLTPYPEPNAPGLPPRRADGGLAWSPTESAGDAPHDYSPPAWYQQPPTAAPAGSAAWRPPESYPPQPPSPYTATAAASGRPPRGQRRRTAWLAAGALLAAAVAAVSIALASDGSGAGSHPAAGLKVIWAAPGTKGTESGTGLAGSWVTATTVVDGRSDGLIAHALTDGHQVWNYQVPAGQTGCSMSSAVSQGIGVLAYGKDRSNCDQLTAFDLSTGKPAWNAPISLTDTSRFPIPVRDPHLAVDGATLATTGPQNTIAAYELATGTKLWATPVDTNIADDTCVVDDVQAAGGTVYGLYSCERLSGTSNKLVGYDERTGAVTWHGDLSSIPAADRYSMALFAAAGRLLLVDQTPKHQTLYAYSAASPAPVRIDLSHDDYDAFATTVRGEQRRPHAYAVYGDTLYLESAPPIHGIADAITAVSLTSGKTLWTQDLGGGIASTIISADARGVHTVLEIPGQSLYQLATYAPADGAVTRGAGTQDGRFTFTSDSTCYLVGDYLVELPASVLPGSPELLVLTGASR